jgi:cytidylate kinase
MTFIVGLAGPANVGKSTTAKRIKEAFSQSYPLIKVGTFAFADKLYETLELLTGVPKETLRDQKYKEVVWTNETAPMPCLVGWTPRKFAQILGTEGIRNNVNKNFWVECAIKSVKTFDIAISEDSRFDTEYVASDMNFELEREGIGYACNHSSAMPPDPKFIYKKIVLTQNINYKDIVTVIMKEKSNKTC